MIERRSLLAIAMVAVFLPLITDAQSWPPPVPTGDSRIFIDEIHEDWLRVAVPYGYGEQDWQESNVIDEWAQWGCGLYQRTAVGISYSISDSACDQIGRAAAMRNPDCLHFHLYACGIPPKSE